MDRKCKTTEKIFKHLVTFGITSLILTENGSFLVVFKQKLTRTNSYKTDKNQ